MVEPPLIPRPVEPLIPDKGAREELATLEAVDVSLGQLTRGLTAIILWKQRIFKVALASAAVAVIAVGLLGWSAWDNHRANQRLHSAVSLNSRAERELRASELTACQERNKLQARNDAVWHRFIVLATAGRSQTPADQKIIRDLLAFADSAFKPVNCTTIFGS